jgi:hypothetical protein
MRLNKSFVLCCVARPAALAALLAGALSAQTGFDTPQKAVDSLLSAASQNDTAALEKIFGPEGKDILSSGDPVQDKNNITGFATRAAEQKSVVVDPKNANRAMLLVGKLDWPFPVPLVKKSGKWQFDAQAGRQEILFRRIGSNELDAIQVCRGFVEAQREYAMLARETTGSAQYAQRLISTPGKRDGLYWKNEDGSDGGLISEIVAKAIAEGYVPGSGSGYHGYHFTILKGQGPAAPLGEMDYVIKGVMIGGFAIMAVPAEYGVSGVKTFIAGYDGVVYEKDLGPETAEIAKKTERYNPDKTWRRTDDEWPPETGK